MGDKQTAKEAGTQPDAGERTPWLLSVMDHIEGQVAFGDTKAGLLLTADSILLAGLTTALTSDRPLFDQASTVTRLLLAGAFLGLVVGLLFALAAITPNHRNLRRRDHGTHRLPASFSWIARQESSAYVACALALDTQELDTSLALLIHGKSQWAYKKFWRLFLASIATMCGVISAAIAAGYSMAG